MVGRRLAPFVLFAAPLLAVGCWFLDQWFAGLAVGSSVNAPPGTPPALSQVYAPFLFVLPYLAAAGVWVFVWRTLAGVRKMLFETLES